MSNWKIYPMDFGKIDVTPVGMPFTISYMGFLLDNGNKKILVDAGIHERVIVDGKAWGGCPAWAGIQNVIDALAKLKVKPDDIDIVLYTHLHNDHAGACSLFTKATHIFQEDEWKNLLDPMPNQLLIKDYDLGVIPELKQLKCVKINSNVEIEDGVRTYRTPGHTIGSQSIGVETGKGLYVLTGDSVLFRREMYPEMNYLISAEGKKISLPPVPGNTCLPNPNTTHNDYDWYRSLDLIKTLIRDDAKYLIGGHDSENLGKVIPE